MSFDKVNYKIKYLKYKNKYLKLNGGKFSIYHSKKTEQIASYTKLYIFICFYYTARISGKEK